MSATLLPLLLLLPIAASALDYPIADTGQNQCYDALEPIEAPAPGEAFFGQDAQHAGAGPSYHLSADGLCVVDEITGLVWQRRADADLDGVLEPEDQLTWDEAQALPAQLNAVAFAGRDDWRLPDIKTLYSLIDFRGTDPSGWEGGSEGLTPFLGEPFDFIWGDVEGGDRLIDAQYWSSTEYVSTTMGGDHTVFGVNFADGRIKGYPSVSPMGVSSHFVLCVSGNPGYGVNQFVAGGDGTVSDLATGLQWTQADGGEALSWADALAWAEGLDFAGHDDWRLPNAKELQSLLDYTRSPATDDEAAIDPIFACTPIVDEGGGSDFPFYWSSTTHANLSQNPGSQAAYVAFGTGLGWMQAPFPPYDWNLLDVHGAGCQRSDPKAGDPDDYPHGHGPQGDVIRIFNFARAVRTLEGAAPEPVGDLRIGIEGGEVRLVWSAPEEGLGYRVYGSIDAMSAFPEEWTLLADGLEETSWSGPLTAIRLFYRVTASPVR